MQSFLIETVIAVLLAVLLWSIDRGRPDPRLRLWAVGWSLCLLHLVSELWHPRHGVQFLAHVRQAHFAALEILAGVCFLLSDPALIRNRAWQIRTGLLVTFPALFTGYVILFRPTAQGLLYLSIVATHSLAIVLARRYIGKNASNFLPLATLYFMSASWMLGCLSSHQPNLVLASIPAEIFLINALLFGRNFSLRNAGNVIAVSGFLLWACSSFLGIALHRPGTVEAVYPVLLNLPQFLVAIGMVMLILEQNAVVSRELVQEYELLFNNNPFPLWIYDLKTSRILSVNPAFARVHGYEVEELSRKKFSDLVHSGPSVTPLEDSPEGPSQNQQHSLHIRKDRTLVPLNVTAYDTRFRGRPVRVGLAEDISEREHMAAQLMFQVRHDTLTGLPNRDTFLHQVEEIFASARTSGSGCAVIVFHINRLEKINQDFGHGVGDEVLKEATRLLQAQLQFRDAIGRTGSREFMIALASVADGEAAEARARQLLRIFDRKILVGGYSIAVSATIGLAVFPEDSDDAACLLRDASRAHARTQVRGAEGLVRLSRKLSLEAQEESRIESVIQNALNHGGFEVYYQPILNTDGKLCSFEALLRLHDAGAIIGPATFIPIAESSGAIIGVGRWVIHEVCRQLKEWQSAGLEIVPVAINVSTLQIVQTNFCADMMSALAQFNIPPARVHLELTESSVMPQDSPALDNMLKLAERGICFSIDDFGTGFSSLDRLHQLPVSTLKIDRTFVQRMLEVDGTLPIVNTIISMAHSLHVGVVAEGVETDEQFCALCEMGCDRFQGFLFSRPVNAAVATVLLSGDHQSLALDTAAKIARSSAATGPRRSPADEAGTPLW